MSEIILIFAANPADQPALSLDKEVREIQNGLRHSQKRIEVKQQWATRPQDLRRALLDHRPTYVHFCGHGQGHDGIALEGHLVQADALADLFRLFSAHIKCVVLNACYSSVQALEIVKHIDFVVGMNDEIGDSAAIEFAAAFYDALGAGDGIEFAFALGCNAIQLAGIPEHLTPKLLTRKHSMAPGPVPRSDARTSRHDWDGAPAASMIFGRDFVAEILRSWIVDESCRVVLLTGLGGIGKTDLATCLGRGGNRSSASSDALTTGIHGKFECVMWRSLLNAPSPGELFGDILDFLSEHEHAATHSSKQLEDILGYLQSRRCFIILDNVEAILKPGDPGMGYREGYERYGTFFELVAKASHKSCLLLTSREKPRAIADMEGARKPVRSYTLTGIDVAESQSLFAQIGTFYGGSEHWAEIVKIYNGNPLALELAARHIDQVFGGDLAAFLGAGQPVIADLEGLLDWHLERLTKEEAELVYWLAIEREPVTLGTLRDDLTSPVSRRNVASTLQSLQRRLPLERIGGQNFTLQPVLIEHITSRLVEQMAAAIASDTGKPQILNTHALVKATAKESVRDSQRRLILSPVAEHLAGRYVNEVPTLATSLLQSWRGDVSREPGYLAGNVIHLLSHLSSNIRDVSFSHVPIWQACLHDINLHEVDFSFAAFREVTFKHPFGTVFCLCYSPDGNLIAVGDDNGEVRVFQGATGQLQIRCVGHSDGVKAVGFSPDGRQIASGSFDNTIRLWTASTGCCIDVLLGHEGWVYSVAFSPDGQLLASCSEDGTCRLWDLNSRESRILATADASGFLAAVAFSPDGEMLAVGGSDCTVTLFRLSDIEQSIVLAKHTSRIRSLAFSRQGDMLASGAEDQQIHIWQPTDGAHLARLSGHSGTVSSLSFSALGDILASASVDFTVRLWSTLRNECVGQMQVASARIGAVECHPYGRTLVTGSEDAAVRVWDMDTGQCLTTLRGYSNKTWSLAFSADPRLLVAGNEDSVVRIWDVRSGRIQHEFRGHPSRIWSIACSPDGKWVASASDDLTVRIWNLRSGACAHIMRGHTDWIRSVDFAPNSLTVASAGEDGRICLWDVVGGTRTVVIESGMARVFSVRFCNHGKCLAVGGNAHEVRLFDAHDGAPLGRLSGHRGWLRMLASFGETFASCSEDGTVKLWDLTRLVCTTTFSIGAKVECGAFSDDGEYFLSGGEDGVLRCWVIKTGACETEIRAHQGSIWSLAVQAPGTRVATTGDDGVIRLWELPSLMASASPNLLRPARPYEGMNVTGTTGLTPAQREALIALGAIAFPTA